METRAHPEDPEPEVVIIGAGAAGLSAGQRLRAAGRRVVLLEARARLGGRIETEWGLAGFPLERGAEFIHGGRVATWRWVAAAGLATAPVDLYRSMRLVTAGGRLMPGWWLWGRPEIWRYHLLSRWLQRYAGPARSLEQLAQQVRLGPWARRLLEVEAHAGGSTAAELGADQLAAYLSRHARRRDDGDHRVLDGHERLLPVLSRGLPVRLATPVRCIEQQADRVLCHTDGGVVVGRRAIVTVPLSALQRGIIAFQPVLPARHRAAIEGLRMGAALKIFLQFERRLWDRRLSLLVGRAADPVLTWWTPRPSQPWLTGFCAGPRAARLAALGEAALLQRAIDQLDQIFGGRASRLVVRAACFDWGAEPWILGGYSAAPPGCHRLRAELARPAGRIHFAGEAAVADDDDPGTVHGALRSGERAAGEVLAAAD